MKRLWIVSLILILCMMTAIYVVLTEQLSLQTAVIGFIGSAFALFLALSFFLKTSIRSLRLPKPYFIAFVACLIAEIFKGSFMTLLSIFDSTTDVRFIQYKTTLKNDTSKCILANAITLTPGTVTADIKGDVLEVLKLCTAREHAPAAALCKMENMLKRAERTKP